MAVKAVLMDLVVLVVLHSDRCLQHEGYEVVAINDLIDPEMLAHL